MANIITCHILALPYPALLSSGIRNNPTAKATCPKRDTRAIDHRCLFTQPQRPVVDSIEPSDALVVCFHMSLAHRRDELCCRLNNCWITLVFGQLETPSRRVSATCIRGLRDTRRCTKYAILYAATRRLDNATNRFWGSYAAMQRRNRPSRDVGGVRVPRQGTSGTLELGSSKLR